MTNGLIAFYRWLAQLDVVKMVQMAVRIALIITVQFFFIAVR